MVTIPEVRDALYDQAQRLRAVGYEVLPEDLASQMVTWADGLHRRRKKTSAPVTSARVTPALARAVREYAAAHPEEPQYKIAQKFNINPGRVSEILAGKRR